MGFSFIGLIITLSIFIVNLTVLFVPPKNIPPDLGGGSIFITILERIGQAGCVIIPVLSKNAFADINLNIWAVLIIFCVLIYYALWIRYIIGKGEFYLLFKPLLFIPVPMAIFPVLAFLLTAMLSTSVLLFIAVICLAVGHIANSLHTYKFLERFR